MKKLIGLVTILIPSMISAEMSYGDRTPYDRSEGFGRVVKDFYHINLSKRKARGSELPPPPPTGAPSPRVADSRGLPAPPRSVVNRYRDDQFSNWRENPLHGRRYSSPKRPELRTITGHMGGNIEPEPRPTPDPTRYPEEEHRTHTISLGAIDFGPPVSAAASNKYVDTKNLPSHIGRKLSRNPSIRRYFDQFAYMRPSNGATRRDSSDKKEMELWKNIFYEVERELQRAGVSSRDLTEYTAQFISGKMTGNILDQYGEPIRTVRKIRSPHATRYMESSLRDLQNSSLFREVSSRYGSTFRRKSEARWVQDILRSLHDRVIGKSRYNLSNRRDRVRYLGAGR